jgi:hypothetical protein
MVLAEGLKYFQIITASDIRFVVCHYCYFVYCYTWVSVSGCRNLHGGKLCPRLCVDWKITGDLPNDCNDLPNDCNVVILRARQSQKMTVLNSGHVINKTPSFQWVRLLEK